MLNITDSSFQQFYCVLVVNQHISMEFYQHYQGHRILYFLHMQWHSL